MNEHLSEMPKMPKSLGQESLLGDCYLKNKHNLNEKRLFTQIHKHHHHNHYHHHQPTTQLTCGRPFNRPQKELISKRKASNFRITKANFNLVSILILLLLSPALANFGASSQTPEVGDAAKAPKASGLLSASLKSTQTEAGQVDAIAGQVGPKISVARGDDITNNEAAKQHHEQIPGAKDANSSLEARRNEIEATTNTTNDNNSNNNSSNNNNFMRNSTDSQLNLFVAANSQSRYMPANVVVATAATSHSHSLSKRSPQWLASAGSNAAPLASESELLPFADFNVQQPAFNDLMKIWPPSTQQSAGTGHHQSHQGRQPESGSQPAPSSIYSSASYQQRMRHLQRTGQYQNILHQQEQHGSLRNHLNEDLDDTLVTADQSFERDQVNEPPTWVNYLGDLGDYLYQQLQHYLDTRSSSSSGDNNGRQSAAGSQPLKLEQIDELLDDYYYDQYENSQVLYYGSQLVREGDISEIGCYLPNDQLAEWTKSGRPLPDPSPLRVIRKSAFLDLKQNYSLKIFEASPSDSGNYRCTRMSRKYHKLVVVPQKTTTAQLYVIQQRLLSVVNPKLMSSPAPLPLVQKYPQASSSGWPPKRPNTNSNGNGNGGSSSNTNNNNNKLAQHQLLPGYLIIENQPLVANCNITDEFVLRRLRENPQFQLAWYKNGKLLKGSSIAHIAGASSNLSPNQSQTMAQFQSQAQAQAQLRRQQQQSPPRASTSTSAGSPSGHQINQRLQFMGANGRQLYIGSASYSDAGDYLCSWSKLPVRQRITTSDDSDSDSILSSVDSEQANNNNNLDAPSQQVSSNPLAAGSMMQLMAPVKLRPFRSSYHVRRSNQLRLVCQIQRGFPAAQLSWYVGNRLVNADFLRDPSNWGYKILHFRQQDQQLIVTSSAHNVPSNESSGGGGGDDDDKSSENRKQIVEVNPIPMSRQQMQLTKNGQGQWMEYRELDDEKYAIETREQQSAYMRLKVVQLFGLRNPQSPLNQDNSAGSSSDQLLLNQAAVSVLVINSLDLARDTSRYACRATSRANTDEVTTLIKVQKSKVNIVKPSTGKATLQLGQAAYFQCEMPEKKSDFLWYLRRLDLPEPILLWPEDDFVEIHNDRLTIKSARSEHAGDYICRATDDVHRPSYIEGEEAVIQFRQQPYIEDFGLKSMSHSGRSTIVTDGERLELICRVHNSSQPSVKIHWMRSKTPDDDTQMVRLEEKRNYRIEGVPTPTESPIDPIPSMQNYLSNDRSAVIVEEIDRYTKRLYIDQVGPEHRSYYACIADNQVTEKTRKVIFVRVKDKLVALWPFLGIMAELFILFTIIYIWETQRAYKELQTVTKQKSEEGRSLRASS